METAPVDGNHQASEYEPTERPHAHPLELPLRGACCLTLVSSEPPLGSLCSLPFYMVHTVVLTFLLCAGNTCWAPQKEKRLWAAPVGFLLSLLVAWSLTHYFEKVRPSGTRPQVVAS